MALLIDSLCKYIGDDHRCISITGSGGKTTALIALARYYALLGKKVLVSTTTKLEPPSIRDYGCDAYFSDDGILSYIPTGNERVFYALSGNERSLAPPLSNLHTLTQHYDVVLLEADGAQHKSLKLHSDRDPVVPSFTTTTMAVMGMSGWGRALAQCCFGWDKDPQRVADDGAYLELLNHPRGVLKAAVGKKLVLCNQAETTRWETMLYIAQHFTQAPLFFGSLQADSLRYRKDACI